MRWVYTTRACGSRFQPGKNPDHRPPERHPTVEAAGYAGLDDRFVGTVGPREPGRAVQGSPLRTHGCGLPPVEVTTFPHAREQS